MYVYTEIRCNICLPSCMVNKYYYIQRRGVTLKSNRSRSWKMGPIDKSYSRACVTITSYGMCFVSKQLASTSFRRQVLSTLLVYIQRWRGSSGNVRLSDLLVSSCLNWQRLSNGHSEAGSLFQSRGPATSHDLSPRLVLDHGMTHVMAPDERRRRPQALTCTRLRDTTVRIHVASTWTSVLPVWSPHGIGQAAMLFLQNRWGVFTTTSPRSVQTAVVEVSCRCRRTRMSCSSPGDWRWTPGLRSLQRRSVGLIRRRWYYAERQTDVTCKHV